MSKEAITALNSPRPRTLVPGGAHRKVVLQDRAVGVRQTVLLSAEEK